MFKSKWKKMLGAAALSLAVFAAGCSSDTSGSEDTIGKGERIELAYVEWDTEIASTHVVGKVLEDLGYDVRLRPLDNAVMWEAVANGEADAMVAAWLPATHAAQFAEYGDKMVDLGANLEGAKIGLVVPSYMDVDSIADLSSEANQSITAIEPGAGVVQAAQQTLEDYSNLSDWRVQTSSSGAMVTALSQAYEKEEDIIVTGWSPHWKFGAYDLKYLDDPEGTFGGEEVIKTMVREGLEEDLEAAYKVLDNFFWETEEMEKVMLEIQNGKDPSDAAAEWVEANEDIVAEWTAGLE
ncbi:glycine betaine ABC transporter substrate-binding protein [Sutcliffiella sp. NC1]|uniref:glycine betaine ABC transporter substrate-binding protein n=1 Tax=Sutcliffiella sp. NC1 TaxID=3004096 RepID=UPI0022DD719F|nr:glycine betaine ABC transporter substrate-binding protein [Sutcliffiella sp. NC1]WBL15548.1 glycine betaine ABC transporter substrate-binding protein [Sutcliffiella sp. NC1]